MTKLTDFFGGGGGFPLGYNVYPLIGEGEGIPAYNIAYDQNIDLGTPIGSPHPFTFGLKNINNGGTVPQYMKPATGFFVYKTYDGTTVWQKSIADLGLSTAYKASKNSGFFSADGSKFYIFTMDTGTTQTQFKLVIIDVVAQTAVELNCSTGDFKFLASSTTTWDIGYLNETTRKIGATLFVENAAGDDVFTSVEVNIDTGVVNLVPEIPATWIVSREPISSSRVYLAHSRLFAWQLILVNDDTAAYDGLRCITRYGATYLACTRTGGLVDNCIVTNDTIELASQLSDLAKTGIDRRLWEARLQEHLETIVGQLT